ncbi:phage tail tape measure protein [Xanthomonas hortorum pv. gardneri]|uniref:phage tail tape measure protein n=1 Tax=Xanthomonas hortorum TaxID=56454 RepID=UPI001E5A8E35|nr:phage tail tape measure protein [Xanthomonas hortorum]MCC8495757.1 phage tail tape measure protein [Xanthomonas hortorum pv. gardneri]MCE4529675.1 phage tail tape measure protein [Xanthomonas hortorum pv. vitians]
MDIAELGFKVDSSGLVESTRALDQNAAAADKASGSADRLERYFQSMSRSIDRSAVALGDRLGGALERIGVGTGTVITELQAMNRAQAEIVSALAAMEGRLSGATSGLKAYSAAGKSAAADASASAAASEKLEQQLAQQEARYRSVAQQAMTYAEAGRTSNLSDRALAEAARDAAAGIDVQAAAMSRAGTEQERMVARARALQEADARTANQAREAAAAAQAQEINLKRLLAQIDPTVAGLNRLAEMEERLERAGDLGLIKPQVMQQYQAQIEASRQALLKSKNTTEQYGMTARQTAAAMRMIPAQMTDIVTSVVAGQPIWMVAIQQGGQLKDQLGGIGPAAKAVSSYVLGMVNPLTVSAAAALALAVALKQSQDELFDFQKNLILTGRNADISGAQFRGLVGEIDKLAGVSRGGAVDALNSVAASGQFAGKQFLMVAEAAARMEASTGQASSKTVEAFQRIARDPVDALVELNRQEGFLNASQLQRIYTLRQEGHEQEAVAEALQLYYERSINVANQAEAAMPGMVKWWRDVKGEISGAWGEVQTYATLLDRVIEKQGLAARFNLGGSLLNSAGAAGGIANMLPDGFMSSINTWVKGGLDAAGGGSGLPTPLFEVQVDGRKAVEDYSKVLHENEAAEKAASEALNARLAGLDRAAAKQQAFNKIIEIYNNLPRNDERHSDGSMQRLIAQSNAQIDKQFNQREGVGKANTDDNAAQTLLGRIQQQITANDELARSGERVSASQRLIDDIDTRLAESKNTMTQSTRRLLEAERERLAMSNDIATASQQEQRDLEARAALTDRLTQLEEQQQRQADLDLVGIGMGADATQVLQRQLDIQRRYFDEMEQLKKRQRGSNPLGANEYQVEVATIEASLARSLDIERNYQTQRMQMLGNWRSGFTAAWADYAFAAANASQQAASAVTNGLSVAEDAFVRFVQTGKLSFSDLTKSILADLARIAARQAIVGAIGSIVGSFAGAAAGGAWSGTSAGAGSNLNFGNNVDSFTGSSWASFGGGRASGGNVSNSSMYEIGEYDRPEIFNDRRGRSYLLPGNDGTVVPMHQLQSGNGGGSATPTVNVSINTVVQSDGSSSTSATTGDDNAMGRALAKLIEPEVKRVLVQQMRPGGLLVGAR